MRYLYRILISLVLLAPISQALADSATETSLHVVISEIQTGTTVSASQEFVELYNPTSADLDLTNWTIDYKSATSVDQSSSWNQRASLSGTIKAHGFYLIAPKPYLSQADAELTPGLAATGGHVRVLDDNNSVVDLVGWGDTANAAETSPAPAPTAGQSLERLPGRLQPDGGNSTDTDDNSKDFLLRTAPEPQSSLAAIELPASGTPDSDPITPPAGEPEPVDPVTTPVLYPSVEITELLPNPAAPLTDVNDEFIEVYNPNTDAVNLEGYVLQTGSGFHYHYTLPSVIISPRGYLALYSSQTGLSLTNTGGAARLLDPTGTVVSLTANYPAAEEGQSWANINGSWQWTLQLTPGALNVLAAPISKPVASAAAPTKSASPKKAPRATSKPKTTTKAAAKPKTTKPKSAKTPAKPLAAQKSSTGPSSNSAKWLLLGVLGLTIGYAIYEFRHDLQNYYYLARRKLRARA